MKLGVLSKWLLLISALVTLAACASGGEGGTGVKKVVSTGRITNTDQTTRSITVNGVRYQTEKAVIEDDDVSSTPDRLQIGVIVTVEGTVDIATGTEGEAEKVLLADALRGPIDQVVSDTEYVILGQTVHVTPNTAVDTGDVPLAEGDFVTVNGFVENTGIMATRIERSNDLSEFEVIGFATGIDADTNQFQLGSLTVDYSNLEGTFDETLLTEFKFVEVEGTLVEGTGVLMATEIEFDELEVEGFDDETDELDFEGIISEVDTANRIFKLQNADIAYDEQTRFSGGDENDLEVGQHVSVEVEIRENDDDDGTKRFVAEEITFLGSIAITSEIATVTGQQLSLVGFENMLIETDESTNYNNTSGPGALQPGDWVSIEARQSSTFNNTATAVVIRKLDGPQTVSLQGRVQAVSSSSLILAGVPIDTASLNINTGNLNTGDSSADQEDDGDGDSELNLQWNSVAVGDLVKITGDLNAGVITWWELQLSSEARQ